MNRNRLIAVTILCTNFKFTFFFSVGDSLWLTMKDIAENEWFWHKIYLTKGYHLKKLILGFYQGSSLQVFSWAFQLYHHFFILNFEILLHLHQLWNSTPWKQHGFHSMLFFSVLFTSNRLVYHLQIWILL